MTGDDSTILTRQPSSNGHDPSLLPQIPPYTAMSLNLPASNGTSSVTGISNQSMRTSSFAMSDADDISEKLSPFDSLRIRRTYSRPRRPRNNVPEDEFSEKQSFNNDSEDNEFLNTDRFIPCNILIPTVGEAQVNDRYGFLKIPSSNGDPPEERNRSAIENMNDNGHGKKTPERHKKHKLLSKKREDILVEPPKPDFETKMTAKEIERTKKWQDMAVVERPDGIIHYHFPVTKKVLSVCLAPSAISSAMESYP